jgi:multiple sugar transport system substrate-binding protein
VDGDPAATPVPPAREEVVTLRVWDFGGIEFEWWDRLVLPVFYEKHPNIRIERLGIPESEFSTKLQTAVAAGEGPDLTLGMDERLAKTGHLLALDEYMARDGLQVDDFFPLFRRGCMLDGKVYALPMNIFSWGMVYNKDLFSAAGLPELDADSVITYDDWLMYARAINKAGDTIEDRVWGSVHFVPRWNAMNNYMSDPYVLGPDGRQCLGNADNEDWIRTWEIMLTAHTEGLTPQSTPGMLGDIGSHDLFRQGKLGMLWGTYGDAIAMRAEGINAGFAGQPVVTKGWEGNVGSWLTAFSILARTKHPEEAWQLLKFLATDGASIMSETREIEGLHAETIGSPPAYKPLAEGWAGEDPLKQANLDLLARVVPPPFTPNVWVSVGPFEEAWRRMTEDGVDVRTAVRDAAIECQEITDRQWDEWEALGQ